MALPNQIISHARAEESLTNSSWPAVSSTSPMIAIISALMRLNNSKLAEWFGLYFFLEYKKI